MSADPNLLSSKPKILVVDDDRAMLRQLEWGLSGEYEVICVDRAEDALAALQRERPEAATLDLALDGESPQTGFELLERILTVDPTLKVILVTGHDARENALQAVDRGAFDFFTKPIDLPELRILLRRAISWRSLEIENAALRDQLQGDQGLGKLLGHSSAIRETFTMVRKVATTDVTVLLAGESGTGKELVAREIHRLSARAARPFVGISCGAIPINLLESELFGHEKGTFTDAHATREGKLELANRGTVFLDEVGEMPLELQVKILRFLQEREIERLGGRRVIPLDVRVVAATNRDLKKEVAAGRFREDLYFRLSVVNIYLPPLRKRGEDVVVLAESFLERYSAAFGRGRMTLSRDALRALQHYAWPGNVRELEHRIQRGIVLAHGRTVRPSDLELEGGPRGSETPLKVVREAAERRAVSDALRRNCGNIARAARELRVSRPTLHDLLRKLDLRASDFKTGLGPEENGEHV